MIILEHMGPWRGGVSGREGENIVLHTYIYYLTCFNVMILAV
jgi:hypothetical protein